MTFKYLEKELNKVGKNIQKTLGAIDSPYGVSCYSIDGLDLKQAKKQSKLSLSQAYTAFQKNRVDYKTELLNVVKMVFDYRNLDSH
mgnify:CR=1